MPNFEMISMAHPENEKISQLWAVINVFIEIIFTLTRNFLHAQSVNTSVRKLSCIRKEKKTIRLTKSRILDSLGSSNNDDLILRKVSFS